MTFAEILSLISKALVHAFAWFTDLIPGDYWVAFMASFAMYTATRLLLMPIIGQASSDNARSVVRGNKTQRSTNYHRSSRGQ